MNLWPTFCLLWGRKVLGPFFFTSFLLNDFLFAFLYTTHHWKRVCSKIKEIPPYGAVFSPKIDLAAKGASIPSLPSKYIPLKCGRLSLSQTLISLSTWLVNWICHKFGSGFFTFFPFWLLLSQTTVISKWKSRPHENLLYFLYTSFQELFTDRCYLYYIFFFMSAVYCTLCSLLIEMIKNWILVS